MIRPVPTRPRRAATVLIAALALTASGAEQAAAQGVWTTTSPLGPRIYHAATSTAEGGAMVVGGVLHPEAGRKTLARIDIWNRETGAWTSAPPLAESRDSPAATLLPGGRVLVTGGRAWVDATGPGERTGWAMRRTAEIWTPEERRWTRAGTMIEPRFRHGATALPDGRVVIWGGVGPELEALRPELFDERTGNFAPLRSFPPDWYGAAFLALGRDQMFVFGGVEGSPIHRAGTVSRRAAIWDHVRDRWEELPPTGVPRFHAAAAAVPDGRVLVLGGETKSSGGLPPYGCTWCASDAELWDPRTNLWRSMPLPGRPRPRVMARLPWGDILLVDPRAAHEPGSALFWSARAGAFSRAAPPLRGLNDATVTALPDGRVLMVGDTERKPQVWDPRGAPAGQFRPYNRPGEARTSPLVPLDGGRLLACGALASRDADPRSCELLDPSSGLWRLSDPLREGRHDHVVVRLPSGDVLAIGGRNDRLGERVRRGSPTAKPRPERAYLASVERWREGGGWSATAPLPLPRHGHTATVLTDGRVLVLGGAYGLYGPNTLDPRIHQPGESVTLPNADAWSPAAPRWNALPPLPRRRAYHTATLLADGRVLVVGATDSTAALSTANLATDVFDPRTNHWAPSGALARARTRHTATLLPDGRVLVAGGLRPHNPWRAERATYEDGAELWDPRTGRFTETGALNMPRADHQAVRLPDGRVLVAGGNVEGGAHVTVAEVWDPRTGKWTPTGAHTSDARGASISLLPEGRVLVLAKSGAEIWLP